MYYAMFLQLLFTLCGCLPFHFSASSRNWQLYENKKMSLSSSHSSVVLSCSEFEVPIYPPGFPFIVSPLSMAGWCLALQILQPTPTFSSPVSQLVYFISWPSGNKPVMWPFCLDFGIFLWNSLHGHHGATPCFQSRFGLNQLSTGYNCWKNYPYPLSLSSNITLLGEAFPDLRVINS